MRTAIIWAHTEVIPTEHVDHEQVDELEEFFSGSSFYITATAGFGALRLDL